jgi:hypothetical protein
MRSFRALPNLRLKKLSGTLPDRRAYNYVHERDSHVTAKPIDCVFYTCDRPIVARVPSEAQSSEWFRILAECFPNSLERFEQLIAPTRPENQTDSDKGYNHAVQPTARLGKLWSKWRARRA